MASCRPSVSLVLAPSVPSATVTPVSSMEAIGATPQPSLALLWGLWTTTAPESARRPISASSTQMVWANDQR